MQIFSTQSSCFLYGLKVLVLSHRRSGENLSVAQIFKANWSDPTKKKNISSNTNLTISLGFYAKGQTQRAEPWNLKSSVLSSNFNQKKTRITPEELQWYPSQVGASVDGMERWKCWNKATIRSSCSLEVGSRAIQTTKCFYKVLLTQTGLKTKERNF